MWALAAYRKMRLADTTQDLLETALLLTTGCLKCYWTLTFKQLNIPVVPCPSHSELNYRVRGSNVTVQGARDPRDPSAAPGNKALPASRAACCCSRAAWSRVHSCRRGGHGSASLRGAQETQKAEGKGMIFPAALSLTQTRFKDEA